MPRLVTQQTRQTIEFVNSCPFNNSRVNVPITISSTLVGVRQRCLIAVRLLWSTVRGG
ncbi:MAG: hypothetical protein NTY19_24345 [Planctomycetota bacterium]|nr:hypothetical protein [Planctomycetota bacterium]